jgi:hypothetical protein
MSNTLVAGTLHKTTARLAGSIAGRLKPLDGIPQRVFPGSNLSDRATPENRIASQFEVTQYDTIGYRSA